MNRKKIVLIEDNADNRLLTQAILEPEFQVECFEDGMTALDKIEISAPDLILLDISLPGMDGIEVLKNIRNIQSLKNTPVIALTAHALPGDKENFLRQGFNDYITKPIIDDNILFETINKWIPPGE
ncbi:MAG: response regulator [Candidatus Neomarinimicrobiota bacterium]|nr:response regulator [Candidatus Neomarinimicrobiota bacterium]RKY47607.1 MAG: response regulator [Candidatus Neomarinimicrobiota bacterium]